MKEIKKDFANTGNDTKSVISNNKNAIHNYKESISQKELREQIKEKEDFGEKLKAMRILRGFTQTRLEEKSGINRSSISKYECNQIIPSKKSIEKLVNALDTTIEELLLIDNKKVDNRAGWILMLVKIVFGENARISIAPNRSN